MPDPKKPKATRQERQAVRKTGAKKEARKGIISDIYSAQYGGRLVTSGTSNKGSVSANQGAVTTSYRTPSNKPKYSAGSQEQKAMEQQKAADVNNAEFKNTRLGSKIVKKATKAAQKSGTSVKTKIAVVKPKVPIFKRKNKNS